MVGLAAVGREVVGGRGEGEEDGDGDGDAAGGDVGVEVVHAMIYAYYCIKTATSRARRWRGCDVAASRMECPSRI